MRLSFRLCHVLLCGIVSIPAAAISQRTYAVLIAGCVVDSLTGAPLGPVFVLPRDARNIGEIVYDRGHRADPDSTGFFRIQAVLPLGATTLTVRLRPPFGPVLRPEIPITVTREKIMNLGLVRLRADSATVDASATSRTVSAQSDERRRALEAECQFALRVATEQVPAPKPGPSASPDSSFYAALRTVIADSVVRARVHPVQQIVSRDRTSDRLLAAAGISFKRSFVGEVHCPSSTAADGSLLPAPVGYHIGLVRTPTWDAQGWLIDVDARCTFIYRGRGEAGALWESWRFEFRRVNNTWRFVRTVEHMMT
jgi:hypothetical protein